MRRRRPPWTPSSVKTRNWNLTGPSWSEIERQLASLKQQLEIERKIVPDEKEVAWLHEDDECRGREGRDRTAALHRQADRSEGVLHRSAVRDGTRRPVLLDAEFL